MKLARVLVVAAALAVGVTLALPQTPTAAEPACRFVLGFEALWDQVGAEIVGPCLEDERFNVASGNAEQRTTGGLLVWRKAENVTAFTDGAKSWVRGPSGVQRRPNDERFAWERDPIQPGTANRQPSPAPERRFPFYAGPGERSDLAPPRLPPVSRPPPAAEPATVPAPPVPLDPMDASEDEPRPMPLPTPTPRPTPKPDRAPERSTDSVDKDCDDFSSQAAAQAHLRRNPSDPDDLDRDRNGIACENNRGPFDRRPVRR